MLKQGLVMPVKKCKELVKAYDHDYHLVGKKKTLHIFDTSGFHRGHYLEGSAVFGQSWVEVDFPEKNFAMRKSL